MGVFPVFEIAQMIRNRLKHLMFIINQEQFLGIFPTKACLHAHITGSNNIFSENFKLTCICSFS